MDCDIDLKPKEMNRHPSPGKEYQGLQCRLGLVFFFFFFISIIMSYVWFKSLCQFAETGSISLNWVNTACQFRRDWPFQWNMQSIKKKIVGKAEKFFCVLTSFFFFQFSYRIILTIDRVLIVWMPYFAIITRSLLLYFEAELFSW